MKKQTMLVLTGLPYAGKTTVSKALAACDFSAVSTDDVIEKRGFDVESMTQDEWNIVYSEAYEQLKRHLSEGKSVVVDIGNLKKSERDTAQRIGNAFGVDSKLVYINTLREEILRRRQENEVIQHRGQLGESLLQKAFDMFEEPTGEERPLIYNQTMNLNDWIATNIEGTTRGIEHNSGIEK